VGRLALIGGRGFERLSPFSAARPLGAGGAGALLDAGAFVVLARHGISSYTPAHRIDHAANVAALIEAGADRALAICSVGSLRREINVGSFLCPDDFIALQGTVPASDGAEGHIVPGFSAGWRRAVIERWQRCAEPELRDGGTYWQTPGPRFETPAEVRLIAAHADVVGMTLASEATVAAELGLAYAAVCVVDNLANGVGDQDLSREEFEAGAEANRATLAGALAGLSAELVEVAT